MAKALSGSPARQTGVTLRKVYDVQRREIPRDFKNVTGHVARRISRCMHTMLDVCQYE